jgi:hypothetical protein
VKKKKIFIQALLLLLIACSAYAQEEETTKSVERIERQLQAIVFVNFSTESAGLGLKMLYDAFNEDTQIGYNFSINTVRGENDITFRDPITFNIVQIREFYTTIVPLMFTYKRRILRDVIASNLRPFIAADIGPVWGYAYNADNGFFGGMNDGKGKLSFGGLVGFGTEIGQGRRQKFTIMLGFHYYRFPDTLGAKKEYKGIDFRVGFLR